MSTLDAAKNFIKENLIHIISVCVYDARWKNYCVRIEMSRRIAAIKLKNLRTKKNGHLTNTPKWKRWNPKKKTNKPTINKIKTTYRLERFEIRTDPSVFRWRYLLGTLSRRNLDRTLIYRPIRWSYCWPAYDWRTKLRYYVRCWKIAR